MFRKKWQLLKYVRKESTHTPDTLRAIPSVILNRFAKTTSRKPSIHSEGVDKIYPHHANALCKAGLAPPNFLTMGYLWSKQDKKVDIEKEPDVKKKQKFLLLCCLITLFSKYIHRVINRLKYYFNLSWTRVWMSYHRFNNLAELLNGDLAAKIGLGIFSKDLMDRECNYSLPSKVNKKYVYKGKFWYKCIIDEVKWSMCDAIFIGNTQ